MSKSKVLVLGSFHMFEEDGLNSERRQKEIVEFVTKLAKFKPTKIAVEMIADNHDSLNHRFNHYIKGNFNLEMNEIYQIGFRLGKMLTHQKIYPIDWIGEAEMGYDEVEQWAEEQQPELLNEIYENLYFPEFTDQKTISDYYKELNDPALLNMLHKLYVNVARISEGKLVVQKESDYVC